MLIQGTIIRAYSSFYYVLVGADVITCKLRGRFRLAECEILVGDRVELEVTGAGTGVIERLLPRSTELTKPRIANVDTAVVVFAARNPDPSLFLIDRFLALIESCRLHIILCLNKVDLADPAEVAAIASLYTGVGYPVVRTVATSGSGVEMLSQMLRGRISVLAGPSGAGKSALLNALHPGVEAKTGDVSAKTGRGRHTTRYAQLVPLQRGGLLADSPGFSYIRLDTMTKDSVQDCFIEFRSLRPHCRFTSCLHDVEPGCAVREAVESGEVHRSRYESYIKLLREVSANEEW